MSQTVTRTDRLKAAHEKLEARDGRGLANVTGRSWKESSYPRFIPSSAYKRSHAHLRRIPGGRCHPSAGATFPTGGDNGRDPIAIPFPGSSPAIEFPAPHRLNSKIRLINHRGYGHHSVRPPLRGRAHLDDLSLLRRITVQLPTER